MGDAEAALHHCMRLVFEMLCVALANASGSAARLMRLRYHDMLSRTRDSHTEPKHTQFVKVVGTARLAQLGVLLRLQTTRMQDGTLRTVKAQHRPACDISCRCGSLQVRW